MHVPQAKYTKVEKAQTEVVHNNYFQYNERSGYLQGERYNKVVIDIWGRCGDDPCQNTDERVILKETGVTDKDGNTGGRTRFLSNSIYMMAVSGARGSIVTRLSSCQVCVV